MPTLISPLARKLCSARGIAPESLRGSGPRGRIMAADVVAPAPSAASGRRGHTAMTDPVRLPTRPAKDGYFIYDAEADMKALADISLPIAVQCEKLLSERYSLFDYIVRAVVKACTSCSSWAESCGGVNVLLFEQEGQKLTAISDAAGKSIYRLARESQSASPTALPESLLPHIIVCDAHTSRDAVASRLRSEARPVFAFVARGGSPKVGIRAGSGTSSMALPYTFYAADSLPEAEANRIAARLHTLLIDPVSLLLL